MANCPKHNYDHPDFDFCYNEPKDFKGACAGCPADSLIARIKYVYLRQIIVRLASLILCIAVFLPSIAQPKVALAVHNPAHDCPGAYAAAIIAGKMGGKAQVVGTGDAQWSGIINGKSYICILRKELVGNARQWVAKTLFRCSRPDCYLLRQANLKGLIISAKPGPIHLTPDIVLSLLPRGCVWKWCAGQGGVYPCRVGNNNY